MLYHTNIRLGRKCIIKNNSIIQFNWNDTFALLVSVLNDHHHSPLCWCVGHLITVANSEYTIWTIYHAYTVPTNHHLSINQLASQWGTDLAYYNHFAGTNILVFFLFLFYYYYYYLLYFYQYLFTEAIRSMINEWIKVPLNLGTFFFFTECPSSPSWPEKTKQSPKRPKPNLKWRTNSQPHWWWQWWWTNELAGQMCTELYRATLSPSITFCPISIALSFNWSCRFVSLHLLFGIETLFRVGLLFSRGPNLYNF